jgi:hypothetical protein
MFPGFQKRLTQWFGRVRIDAGKTGQSTDAALIVNQDPLNTGNLLDLQVSGVSKFKVDKSGVIYAKNNYSTSSGVLFGDPEGNGSKFFGFANATVYRFTENTSGQYNQVTIRCDRNNGNSGVNIASDGAFSINTGTTSTDAPAGTILRSDATGVFAQRNGTNVQESRIYATYTSATNYQRLSTKTILQSVTVASGTTVTTTISIPKFSHLIGVTTRVTTLLSGTLTGYSVGDGTDPDLWGAITGTAVGTTSDASNFTSIAALGPAVTDRTITLTATGADFAGGVIDVCAYYLRAEAD